MSYFRDQIPGRDPAARQYVCEAKQGFDTKPLALNVAKRSKTPKDLQVYRCTFCGKWHLGRKKMQKSFAVRVW